MRYRMPFVMGLAVGYVLGSRAGRERYEQIKRTAQRVADNPRVQEAAGVVGAQVSKAGETARSKVGPLQERMMSLKNRHRHDGEAGTGWPEETADQPKTAEQSKMPY